MIPVLSLDMENPMDFIERYGSFDTVKVGHNLAVYGRKLLDELENLGLEIILDLKFCDIPSTVARSIKSWDHPAVKGFTIHSAADYESVRAALGVTEKHVFTVIKLTSMAGSLNDFREKIYALDSLGCDFVLPGKWALELRDQVEGRFLVPGIRSTRQLDDQKDIITLEEVAGLNDFAVIGREVYMNERPGEKIEEIKGLMTICR